MALLWFDGFEGYGTVGANVSPSTVLSRRYGGANLTAASVQAGRFGGKALQGLSSTNYLKLNTPPLTTDKTLIVGFALWCSSLAYATTFLSLYSNETLGINLKLNSYGRITVYQGASVSYRSELGIFNPLRWHYVELKVYCDPGAGSVQLWLDGEIVTTLINVNTQAGTEAYYNIVSLDGTANAFQPIYDDFYVCDGTGTVNNNILGSVSIKPIFPAGVGDAAQWTGSTTGDHYTFVDETAANDDTDYVEDSVSGNKELWAYGDIPAVKSVKGIMVHTDARVTDATSLTLKTPVKTNGAESEDTGQTISSSSYVTNSRLMEINPVTGVAWTQDDINNLQLGVKVG